MQFAIPTVWREPKDHSSDVKTAKVKQSRYRPAVAQRVPGS